MEAIRFVRRSLSLAVTALILSDAAALYAAPATTHQANTVEVAQPEVELRERLGDESISEVVAQELLLDPIVTGHAIDVSVQNGIVTLEGVARNVLANDRAVKIAQAVRGVNSVIDRIDVVPVEKTDLEIAEDIRWVLALNPPTEHYEVEITVENGNVTLEGDVDSWPERRLAERLAKSVRGVKSVENSIVVTSITPRPEAEILEDVEQSLAWNKLIDDSMIRVEVEQGVVTLLGHVGSAVEKEEAILSANVAGVTEVDADRLVLSPFLPRTQLREAKYVDRPGDDIERTVSRAIQYDPRVQSGNVMVDVDEATVVLQGEVPTLAAARAAVQDARNTVGVLEVQNRLAVDSEGQPDDQQLEKAVKRAMLINPHLERRDVTATVTNGTAVLDGRVENYFEKAQAEMAAERIAGITEIDNKLTVENRAPVANDPRIDEWQMEDFAWYKPERLSTDGADGPPNTESVMNQLWWNPFIESEEINVEVEDGVVTLTGTVGTPLEKREAEQEAIEGGATSVQNKIKVQSES